MPVPRLRLALRDRAAYGPQTPTRRPEAVAHRGIAMRAYSTRFLAGSRVPGGHVGSFGAISSRGCPTPNASIFFFRSGHARTGTRKGGVFT